MFAQKMKAQYEGKHNHDANVTSIAGLTKPLNIERQEGRYLTICIYGGSYRLSLLDGLIYMLAPL